MRPVRRLRRVVKRRTFRAYVRAADGATVGERDTFAWNSAVRATEAIVREWARDNYAPATGALPIVADADEIGPRLYRRAWTTATGRELTALVWEVVG